jgi:hypothetical protein
MEIGDKKKGIKFMDIECAENGNKIKICCIQKINFKICKKN